MARMLLQIRYGGQCGCCLPNMTDSKGRHKAKRAQRRREKQQFRREG